MSFIKSIGVPFSTWVKIYNSLRKQFYPVGKIEAKAIKARSKPSSKLVNTDED